MWIPFVEFLETATGTAISFSGEGVWTRSNVNFDVLSDILMSIGLDTQPYVLKENLIDKGLLDKRNRIAHGRYEIASQAEFIDLRDQVLGMLDSLRAQISNAAQRSEYKVS